MGGAITTSPQGQGNGVHWSKDYVEHLRTVHFSLVAVSLALIVLGSSGTPAELSRARQQIQDIAELTRRGAWDERFIEKTAESLIKDADQQKPGGGLLLATFREYREFRSLDSNRFEPSPVAFSGPNWLIASKARNYSQGQADEIVSPGYIPRELLFSPPRTLQDFRNVWDVLQEPHSVRIPKEISTTMYLTYTGFQTPAFTSRAGQWTNARGREDESSVELKLGCLSEELRKIIPPPSNEYAYFATFPGRDKSTADFHRPDPDTEGIFPVLHYEELPFDAQQQLIQRFPRDRQPKHGSFEYSFHDLDAFTRNYQTLEIPRFDAILEAEQGRTGESFEAFGVKFPAQGTTRWGILVVLGIQLYFLIHLRELAGQLKPEDPGWDVAWVGVYDSRLAKTVFVFSAFVLPVCSVGALGIRGIYVSDFGKLYWITFSLGITASIALALCGWIHLRNLRDGSRMATPPCGDSGTTG